MDEVSERIDAWQASGLIDEATAARLRAAEATRSDRDAPGPRASRSATMAVAPVPDLGAAAAVIGPVASIGELFGYLGGIFLLGAWVAFVDQLADGSDLGLGVGAAVAALGVAVVGLALGRADARRSRAAGVCFLTSTALALIAGLELAQAADIDGPRAMILGGVVGVVVAAVFRWHHPALLTQIALLTSVTVLAAGGLAWISDSVGRPAGWDDRGYFRQATGADPIFLVLGQAAWWLAWALGIGYVALLEDRGERADDDDSAHRRASLTRLWAGLVAVLGLTSALRLEDGSTEYQMTRVVPPIAGDVAILLLCAVLIERAFHRDATAFLWAAALGVIIALTDLNLSYVEGNTWVALLIEGAILVAVAFWADRLRRMLRGVHPRRDTTGHIGRPRPPRAPVPG
jgi:hypothetical protein